MVIETRRLAVQTHGRYLLAPTADAAGWLVGFHGYAHHAGHMLDELKKIPGADRWMLVSIQALHRFYNRDDQVVASWMTRQDRELAIADNIAYVDAVLADVVREYGTPRRLVFAGFSQGVAMAYRAGAHAKPDADALIVLAGDVPPEVAADGARLPQVLLGRGTRDTWYTAEKMNSDLRVLAAHGVAVEPVVFDGGHEWSDPFFAAAGTLLSALEAER